MKLICTVIILSPLFGLGISGAGVFGQREPEEHVEMDIRAPVEPPPRDLRYRDEREIDPR